MNCSRLQGPVRIERELAEVTEVVMVLSQGGVLKARNPVQVFSYSVDLRAANYLSLKDYLAREGFIIPSEYPIARSILKL
jgi:hypothetical protein